MLVSPACIYKLSHVLKYVLNRLFIVSKNIFLQIIYVWHQTNTQKITFWVSLLPVAKYFHIRPYIYLKSNIVYAIAFQPYIILVINAPGDTVTEKHV